MKQYFEEQIKGIIDNNPDTILFFAFEEEQGYTEDMRKINIRIDKFLYGQLEETFSKYEFVRYLNEENAGKSIPLFKKKK